MKVWMTHNPRCGTSRNVLAALEARGIVPEVRDYLKVPLSRAELAALVQEMGVPVHALMRWKEQETVAAAGIAETSGAAALLDAMVRHPVLLNRPIVRTGKGIRLCRPSERVNDLL